MAFRVGLDIGGTFTDFILLNEATGELEILKVPSTPQDPSRAVLEGLERLIRRRIRPSEIAFFSHGTTVTTNALIEGRGVKAGLLITEGFRGIYETMDQTRGYGPATYDLYFEKPRMLVPPRLTEEIPERVDYRGEVLKPLDEAAARRTIERLSRQGVEAVAVCLLFSFMNPAHEARLKALVEEQMPEAYISLSSEVLPQIREYYRLCTTVVNAYIGPILARYLRSMEGQVRALGIATRQLYVMQSNGGVRTFGAAAPMAAATMLSGPAAGVIAGAGIGALVGPRQLITMDMGGTSCDVALIDHGEPIQTTSGKIGGWDVSLPMIEINTIGAGGGTIAWIDPVGQLRVGPQSAGAEPGPACYGRGGTEPTVTDANVVLGYINPDFFLGGQIPLSREKAEEAIETKVARPLGLPLLEAARGIIRIVNVKMEESIKAISSQRGYDLREFLLVAFGGAGPVHAGALAAELGIGRVLVPPMPGGTSAMGLLMSDVRHDYVRTFLRPLSLLTPEQVARIFTELEARGLEEMAAEGFARRDVELAYFLDMRYAGQGYELTVPVPEGKEAARDLGAMRTRFDLQHERLHGHKAETAPVEVVNYRVVATARVAKAALRESREGGRDPAAARIGERLAFFPEYGEGVVVPVYRRHLLSPGNFLPGPAIVEQLESTVVIYPRQEATVDAYGNVLIRTEKV